MRILFFCPDAHSVFFPETKFIFGGVETEIFLTARGLSERPGMDVIVVTRDQGMPVTYAGKVNVVPHPGIKGEGYWEKQRSLQNRISTKIFGSREATVDDVEFYDTLNPDVVYVMGLNPRMKELAEYCKLRMRKLIFKAAHDMDFGGLENDDVKTEKWAGRSMSELRKLYASADVILVQNPFQQQILKERFNRESVLILNPIELGEKPVVAEKKYDVLWVGKNNHFKRPELMVEVAKSMPQRSFCMICNKFDGTTWDEFVATIPSNVTLIESVPAGEIQNYFAESRLFLSTSPHEGFANTFLQAANSGVPVVSMCSNPNEMLTKHDAGIVCGEMVSECAGALTTLLDNDELSRRKSTAAFEYIKHYHDLSAVLMKVETILSEIILYTA